MGVDAAEAERRGFRRRGSAPAIDRSTAVGTYIKVQGLDDAMAALRELPRKLRVGALRQALRASGNIIKAEARRLAPVLGDAQSYTSLKTRRVVRPKNRNINRIRGLVKRSLTVRGSRLARQRGDLGVYVTVSRSKAARSKGSFTNLKTRKVVKPNDPFYFKFLEEGTKHMAARQFLTPSLNSKSPQAIEAFSGVLQKAIAVENSRR